MASTQEMTIPSANSLAAEIFEMPIHCVLSSREIVGNYLLMQQRVLIT